MVVLQSRVCMATMRKLSRSRVWVGFMLDELGLGAPESGALGLVFKGLQRGSTPILLKQKQLTSALFQAFARLIHAYF